MNMPARDLGNKFLVICSKTMVMDIMKSAEAQNLFKLNTQWIFVITDTHSMDFDMSEFINMGKDGYNVGFVFNASLQQATQDCSR